MVANYSVSGKKSHRTSKQRLVATSTVAVGVIWTCTMQGGEQTNFATRAVGRQQTAPSLRGYSGTSAKAVSAASSPTAAAESSSHTSMAMVAPPALLVLTAAGLRTTSKRGVRQADQRVAVQRGPWRDRVARFLGLKPSEDDDDKAEEEAKPAEEKSEPVEEKKEKKELWADRVLRVSEEPEPPVAAEETKTSTSSSSSSDSGSSSSSSSVSSLSSPISSASVSKKLSAFWSDVVGTNTEITELDARRYGFILLLLSLFIVVVFSK